MSQNTSTFVKGAVERLFEQLSTPTEEDLKRVMTREEQEELCTKYKCRVQMVRWNPCADYRAGFIEHGRFQRWNDKLRLRMLAHSVNSRMSVCLYDEKEIEQTRKKEWELRKKECILLLAYWKRQTEKQKNETQCVIETPCVIETQSINVPDAQIGDIFGDVNTESMSINTESMAISTQSSAEPLMLPSQDIISQDYEYFNNEIPLTSTQSQ